MNQSVVRADIVARAKKMKVPKPKFHFGKYNRKTLQWVAEHDPQYIVWVGRNVCKSYWPLGLQQIYDDLKPFAHRLEDEDADPDDVMEQWARQIADE